ncbi:hypothetical protein CONLIGDRAFT_69188 [Coniochaeta ligniaria NRRL 30616]|uniref:Uncharacterized protein n=1 Tax=Coniochaeta ligniaria NRRL 30616 TaxID=1408157 RepID=A0A1J7IBX9_9PEZI|nr:hypothetical protein CONLIGDRAFT_69188 [Coniochaeta ligniaria NRRL 30616]
MARTRRQAARQPEPATDPQPDEPSSGDDSDIPAAGESRSRPDPYDMVATLRPSREQRPKVFLRTSKRGATVAQPGSQSPSEAKKRRRESAIPSSSAKRAKASTADGVNPVAMQIMNDFNKKTRAKQGTRAPQMRSITVELKQSSARTSTARTVPEARVDEEEQADDQSDEEVEREQPSKPADYETTAEPEVERSHPQPPQVAHTRTSERDADELPPRSGQRRSPPVATQQEPPSQRSPRKSKPRKTKPAFGERPLVEKTGRSVSKSASAVPRTSEQPQAATTKPASGQTTAEKSILIGDDDSEEDEADDAEEDEADDIEEDEADDRLEEPSSDKDARDSLFHQAPSTTEGQLTVHVRSKEVRSMYNLMGRKGWTAYGRSWAKDLSQPATLKHAGLPATSFGLKIHKFVVFLRSEYQTAPQVRHVARQNTFLQEKSKKTEKAVVEITRLVEKIRNQYHTVVEGNDDGNGLRLRDVMKKDLIQCIIPLLVLLLREFFFLGGSSLDAEDDRELPEKGGDFTSTTLQFLVRASGWISRLAPIIRREAELSGFAPSSDDEEEEPPKSTAGKKTKSLPRQKFEERAKQRILLDDIAHQLHRTLTSALAQLDEDANREARRKARLERADEVKAEKEQEERDARMKSQRGWEAMCTSTQRLRDGIGPVSSMWVKAQQLDEKRAAERQRELAERERMGSPHLGGFFDEFPFRAAGHGQSEASLYPPEARPVAATEDHVSTAKRWTIVESQWLLGKLKEGLRPDYDSWAEALGRRVDEVKQEVYLLKLSARKLAEERRKTAPAWALPSS